MKKILALLVITSLMSCGLLKKNQKPFQGKTTFTHEIRKQIEDFADITKVQFYTTRTIKMKRISSSKDLEVTDDGKVVVKQGEKAESVTLERDLPGVCISAFEDRLQISFSDGTYLVFRRDFIGTYSLLVERDLSGKAKIQYGTETYELAPGSDEAKLAIDKQFKREDNKDQRNEQGRRIGGGSY